MYKVYKEKELIGTYEGVFLLHSDAGIPKRAVMMYECLMENPSLIKLIANDDSGSVTQVTKHYITLPGTVLYKIEKCSMWEVTSEEGRIPKWYDSLEDIMMGIFKGDFTHKDIVKDISVKAISDVQYEIVINGRFYNAEVV
tara:strand:+ start:722 stop:1144 length:423 start_codon:yes stop_codon:yes gene_type:complete